MGKKTETSFEFIKRRLNEEGYLCKEVIASPYFDMTWLMKTIFV